MSQNIHVDVDAHEGEDGEVHSIMSQLAGGQELADSDGKPENWGNGEDTSVDLGINDPDAHEGEDGEAHTAFVMCPNGEDDRCDSDPAKKASAVVEDPDAHEGEDGEAHTLVPCCTGASDMADSDGPESNWAD